MLNFLANPYNIIIIAVIVLLICFVVLARKYEELRDKVDFLEMQFWFKKLGIKHHSKADHEKAKGD